MIERSGTCARYSFSPGRIRPGCGSGNEFLVVLRLTRRGPPPPGIPALIALHDPRRRSGGGWSRAWGTCCGRTQHESGAPSQEPHPRLRLEVEALEEAV